MVLDAASIFTILTFLLVDIQRSFTVDKALAGALGTITLIFRVAGGIGAGTAADRWGRKGPLMFLDPCGTRSSRSSGASRRRTACCSRSARCSGSAWEASGRRECR
jgi:MFS family permease